MIVKIHDSGRSFKGLSQYLMHDPKADTADRVAWTRTLNLANDHVPSAVNEMYLTAENADLLKAEAGIPAGGRTTEYPVKHVSLSWGLDETPSREQMTDAVTEYLDHMGWDQHQVLVVAHNDKKFEHCHLVINAVHAETGLKLDDSFDQRRSQQWALEYELRNGRVLCENRLLDVADREDGPTRPAWMAFQEKQQEFARQEKMQRDAAQAENPGELIPENADRAEWKKLKEIQRAERDGFFAQGKLEFRELRTEIYKEVREEFSPVWRDYYYDLKHGADLRELAERKAQLIADQKQILEERRDEACGDLLRERRLLYGQLLFEQKAERAGLRERQNEGLSTGEWLGWREAGRPNVETGFREAAKEITAPDAMRIDADPAPAFTGWAREDNGRVRSGLDTGARMAEDLGFGAISLFESLFDGFVGAKPDPHPREPAPAPPPGPDPFEQAVKEGRERQAREREEADEEWRARQRGRDGG